MKEFDRRNFLRYSAVALGIGTVYHLLPGTASAATAGWLDHLGSKNGEPPAPFSFVQLSDAHVGFHGPPDPLGTQAFERAVDMVNALPQPPELVLFTGDLTHDSEDRDLHAVRMRQFKEIAGRLRAPKLFVVPGEHDAGLDGGTLFREHFGETHYSFDHRGVHFIALDNVSRARPEVGAQQLAWLQRDLARFPQSAPLVVFTHRPLFDLKPEWEWFTSDGDAVMNALAPYENVTVLYGHIHRDDIHQEAHATHYGTRSLIFAFPDPATAPAKNPLAFDKDQPFRELGIRQVAESAGRPAVRDIELTLRETGGVNGIQQFLKSQIA